MKREELLTQLANGALLPQLSAVYGRQDKEACSRLLELTREFSTVFPCGAGTETLLFSAPGRTELGGNHTDHQHGCALAASVNLDTIACVVPNDSGLIRIKSRGHRMAEVDLNTLARQEAERSSSASLVRGVAARIAEMGYTLSGFDAYTTTRILRGGGLSSSAAFEVLAAAIINHLSCGGALSPLQLAQIGQYAENTYYGKPCGLLDQIACACGGVSAIDFSDPASPAITQLQLDLEQTGFALCIVDTQDSHADLTDDYAAIPAEMGSAAAFFGKAVLREVDLPLFLSQLPAVRSACGDRAVLRALHYYTENHRAAQEKDALQRGDFPAFLRLVEQSGHSSFMYLQNVSTFRSSRSQPMAVLLAAAELLLDGQGACRVHGGGFAGAIQAFVPLEKLALFYREMESIAGQGACHVLSLRPQGVLCLVP